MGFSPPARTRESSRPKVTLPPHRSRRCSGQYPPAVALAQSIATSQQKEIDEMQAILASL